MKITVEVNDSTIEEWIDEGYSLDEISIRLRGLYMANLYEDVKWVVETIDEDRAADLTN